MPLWQQRGQVWPGVAGWTSVVGWDHSVGVDPEAFLGLMGCQSDAGQAGFAHVAKTYMD